MKKKKICFKILLKFFFIFIYYNSKIVKYIMGAPRKLSRKNKLKKKRKRTSNFKMKQPLRKKPNNRKLSNNTLQKGGGFADWFGKSTKKLKELKDIKRQTHKEKILQKPLNLKTNNKILYIGYKTSPKAKTDFSKLNESIKNTENNLKTILNDFQVKDLTQLPLSTLSEDNRIKLSTALNESTYEKIKNIDLNSIEYNIDIYLYSNSEELKKNNYVTLFIENKDNILKNINEKKNPYKNLENDTNPFLKTDLFENIIIDKDDFIYKKIEKCIHLLKNFVPTTFEPNLRIDILTCIKFPTIIYNKHELNNAHITNIITHSNSIIYFYKYERKEFCVKLFIDENMNIENIQHIIDEKINLILNNSDINKCFIDYKIEPSSQCLIMEKAHGSLFDIKEHLDVENIGTLLKILHNILIKLLNKGFKYFNLRLENILFRTIDRYTIEIVLGDIESIYNDNYKFNEDLLYPFDFYRILFHNDTNNTNVINCINSKTYVKDYIYKYLCLGLFLTLYFNLDGNNMNMVKILKTDQKEQLNTFNFIELIDTIHNIELKKYILFENIYEIEEPEEPEEPKKTPHTFEEFITKIFDFIKDRYTKIPSFDTRNIEILDNLENLSDKAMHNNFETIIKKDFSNKYYFNLNYKSDENIDIKIEKLKKKFKILKVFNDTYEKVKTLDTKFEHYNTFTDYRFNKMYIPDINYVNIMNTFNNNKPGSYTKNQNTRQIKNYDYFKILENNECITHRRDQPFNISISIKSVKLDTKNDIHNELIDYLEALSDSNFEHEVYDKFHKDYKKTYSIYIKIFNKIIKYFKCYTKKNKYESENLFNRTFNLIIDNCMSEDISKHNSIEKNLRMLLVYIRETQKSKNIFSIYDELKKYIINTILVNSIPLNEIFELKTYSNRKISDIRLYVKQFKNREITNSDLQYKLKTECYIDIDMDLNLYIEFIENKYKIDTYGIDAQNISLYKIIDELLLIYIHYKKKKTGHETKYEASYKPNDDYRDYYYDFFYIFDELKIMDIIDDECNKFTFSNLTFNVTDKYNNTKYQMITQNYKKDTKDNTINSLNNQINDDLFDEINTEYEIKKNSKFKLKLKPEININNLNNHQIILRNDQKKLKNVIRFDNIYNDKHICIETKVETKVKTEVETEAQKEIYTLIDKDKDKDKYQIFQTPLNEASIFYCKDKLVSQIFSISRTKYKINIILVSKKNDGLQNNYIDVENVFLHKFRESTFFLENKNGKYYSLKFENNKDLNKKDEKEAISIEYRDSQIEISCPVHDKSLLDNSAKSKFIFIKYRDGSYEIMHLENLFYYIDMNIPIVNNISNYDTVNTYKDSKITYEKSNDTLKINKNVYKIKFPLINPKERIIETIFKRNLTTKLEDLKDTSGNKIFFQICDIKINIGNSKFELIVKLLKDKDDYIKQIIESIKDVVSKQLNKNTFNSSNKLLLHFNIFKNLLINNETRLYNLKSPIINKIMSTQDEDFFYFYDIKKIQDIINNKNNKNTGNLFLYLSHIEIFEKYEFIKLILFVSDSNKKLLTRFLYAIEINNNFKNINVNSDINNTKDTECSYYILNQNTQISTPEENKKFFPTFIINKDEKLHKITSIFDDKYLKIYETDFYKYPTVINKMNENYSYNDKTDQDYEYLIPSEHIYKELENTKVIQNIQNFRILNLNLKFSSDIYKNILEKYEVKERAEILAITYLFYKKSDTETTYKELSSYKEGIEVFPYQTKFEELYDNIINILDTDENNFYKIFLDALLK